MNFLWELLAVAVGTYLLRASVILLSSRLAVPARLESTLRLIPAAVLPAIVANALVLDAGRVRPFGPWYVAFLVAALVAWRTRSAGWTLLVGMVSVWLLSALW